MIAQVVADHVDRQHQQKQADAGQGKFNMAARFQRRNDLPVVTQGQYSNRTDIQVLPEFTIPEKIYYHPPSLLCWLKDRVVV